RTPPTITLAQDVVGSPRRAAAAPLRSSADDQDAGFQRRRGVAPDGGPDQPDDGDGRPLLRGPSRPPAPPPRARRAAARLSPLPAACGGASAGPRPAALGERRPLRPGRPPSPRGAAGTRRQGEAGGPGQRPDE